MLLRQLWVESRIEYIGTLPATLGNGEEFTLNYGGAPGKPPFLFAPFPLSAIRNLRNKLSKCRIVPPVYGNEGTVDCSKKQSKQSKIAHVGEAHCTIEAFNLAKAIERLKRQYNTDSDIEALIKAGLFTKNGDGMPFPMKVASKNGQIDYLIVNSFAHDDKWDNPITGSPVVVAARIIAPRWEAVKEILGIEPYPVLPNGSRYIPHVTIGYTHARTITSPEAEKESPSDIRKQVGRSYLKNAHQRAFK